MGKNKNRGPKVSSSLFAALPTELRNTFMANASKTVYVSPPTQDAAAATTGAASIPPPPEVAVVVASTIASSPCLAPGGKKRKRVEPAAPAALPVVVSVKRRKPWTEEDGSTHPWDCTGMVTRYSRDKQVPKDLKKCERCLKGEPGNWTKRPPVRLRPTDASLVALQRAADSHGLGRMVLRYSRADSYPDRRAVAMRQ